MSARRKRLFSQRPGRRRRLLAIAGVLLLVLVGIGLGAYFYERNRTGSVYHPHAPFTQESTPTALPKRPPDRFSWPNYGYTKDHSRFFPAPASLRPPFRQLWVRNAHELLEFPPVIYAGRLFQLGDHAVLTATNKHTGKVVWKRKLGRLSAASPAVTSNTVYVTVLDSGRGAPGRVFAINSKNGVTRWSRALPSRAESSPLVDGDKVFFGSEAGTVYALGASHGNVLWTYHAGGAVKASPTLSKGVLYFGDYSGHLQAVSERNGHLLWRSGSGGALLGSGTFYSTAAVFYGRVYLGNTDGRIYAYDARTGSLDWAVQTGAYVYSSPAVTNAPGLGPTIYLGSYNGTFYALNARSGHVSWTFNAGARISGSATIIGRVVYFSDLGDHRTFGLGISTGRKLFQKETGAFDPVISDGKNIYLSGYTGVYALAPR
jgi:outer membrane protein assembly factor BamB